jgi:hypothetical protein
LLRFFVSRQRNEEEKQVKEKTFGVWDSAARIWDLRFEI